MFYFPVLDLLMGASCAATRGGGSTGFDASRLTQFGDVGMVPNARLIGNQNYFTMTQPVVPATQHTMSLRENLGVPHYPTAHFGMYGLFGQVSDSTSALMLSAVPWIILSNLDEASVSSSHGMLALIKIRV